MKDDEVDNHPVETFWKFFIPRLTDDVSKLPAAGPGGSCWVTNTLGVIWRIENGTSGLGDRELKKLQKFVSKWRKQEGYPKRLDEETEALAKSSRKYAGFLKKGMLLEEFQNLVGTRDMLERLKNEMKEVSPVKSKELAKEIAWLDKEFKERTVPAPPEWEAQHVPWYQNRWPSFELKKYNKLKKKLKQGICPSCGGKLTITDEFTRERKGMLEDGNNELERTIVRYQCKKCGERNSLEILRKVK